MSGQKLTMSDFSSLLDAHREVSRLSGKLKTAREPATPATDYPDGMLAEAAKYIGMALIELWGGA